MGNCLTLPTDKVDLLEPFKVGEYKLKNRMVNAALTRRRAGDEGIPTDLMAEYYASRSSFGLILTECNTVSELGNAYPGAAGIYN